MDTSQGLRVAVIGAGPRGISVLDRLLARYLELPAEDRPELDIRMVDPFTPGSGHVWRTGQPRLFLMNTPCLFPTVVPAPEEGFAPSVSGLSFGDWAQAMEADPAPALSAGDREEIARLGPGDSPAGPCTAVIWNGPMPAWPRRQRRPAPPSSITGPRPCHWPAPAPVSPWNSRARQPWRLTPSFWPLGICPRP